MCTRWFAVFLLFTIAAAGSISAGQNPAGELRRIPPVGIEIPAEDRADLEAGVAALGREIESLREALKNNPALLELLPDVQIFHNAVRYALQYNELFKPEQIK